MVELVILRELNMGDRLLAALQRARGRQRPRAQGEAKWHTK
jgi:hypothetical protein